MYPNITQRKHSWISIATMVMGTGHMVTVHVYAISCLLTESTSGAVSPLTDRNVFYKITWNSEMSQKPSPCNLFFTQNILLAISWAWSRKILSWLLFGYSEHIKIKIPWHVGVFVQLRAVTFILQNYIGSCLMPLPEKTNLSKIFTPKYNFFLSVALCSFCVYFLFFLCLSLSVYVSLHPCVIWFSSSCCLCLKFFFLL